MCGRLSGKRTRSGLSNPADKHKEPVCMHRLFERERVLIKLRLPAEVWHEHRPFTIDAHDGSIF